MKKADELKNWKEYLEKKFSDDSLYLIIDNTDNPSDGIYRVVSKTNKTVIDFIWPDKHWKTLDDIQYHNESAKGWSGELLGGNSPKTGRFNKENIENIEQLLEIPLKKGWISEEYYFGNKLFKAVTYENNNGKRKARIFTDFHSGYIGIMLFPLTLLLNITLRFGLIGKKKVVVVEPIEEQPNTNKAHKLNIG
jgi:hypothetical protein